MLGVTGIDPCRAEANALSIPPGEYGRKAETQRSCRGPAQAVEHVVQFDHAKNLTQARTAIDIRRKPAPARAIVEVLHGCRQLVS